MTTSDLLGEAHVVDLGDARIRYRDRGDGPPVVFVHGLLTNGLLWRKVAPAVADAGFRCLTPDWPLGSHEIPVPNAELSPPGVAALIARFLETLDLTDVTVVANDTGGALTQLLMTTNPERVGRVVLTPSDCFERFLPPLFAGLSPLARIPGGVGLVTAALRRRWLLKATDFLWLAKHPVPDHILDAYLLPSRRSAEIRDDLRRFMASVHNRYTLTAAERLPAFTKPVLLAWAPEDRHFPLRVGRKLAGVLPNAELKTIEDSYAFVPEDQPERLSGMMVEFLRAHATT
ncbi:alpha/beta fold hydrolase [Amycolatopsis keratiniphila]|uniref:Alpha/beta hydrolase n=1 Tax=Amycolatopsis keratiniphila subsp. keratiniphila TaxID=227715 RepID=A0A1W2LMH7_9PSEU|nr:alpha/beta hydrolase [Amycolatopsis keratiniphila]OLZ48810.1 alpha/beta hydrolase [Amycolatopsis keratiniphila subsp. nogabecina]ONF64221.1 alpha/beta hydrolase [Amycolatopsis keratiniphila subsp. keratiniphila]SDU33950.1 Pimeloyl-ACP methyl ester carboxylesterase [Amycolatopsis keratiniphila]